MAVVGYCVVRFVAGELGGSELGKLLSFLWLVVQLPLVYFAVAGARRTKGHWQCPDCRLFNRPSTLVCDCGYRLNAEPEVVL